MGTGQGADEGSRSPKWAHRQGSSLARFEFAKPTVAQLFVRFLFAFPFFFSYQCRSRRPRSEQDRLPRSMDLTVVMEGGDLVNSDDDAECTVSDPPLAMEGEGVVAESSVRCKMANPLELDFRRAGLHLKAIKALADVVSKRAALPTPADLEGGKYGPTGGFARLPWRASLTPPQGSRRKPLLKLIEEFLEDLVDLDLDEVQLQDAPPAAAEVGLADEDDDDVARLRALEERDFQTQVEEAEREYAVDVEAAAKRERDEVKEALAAVHTSNMKALQERLGAVKRARTAPSPLLTESRIARMDKGVPRPVAQPVRPGDLRPAAPPPDVERPVRVEAEN